MVGVQLKGRASCYIGRILLKLEALSWLVEGAKVEKPPYNEGASIFMEVPPIVEECYIYLEGAILVLEGATFGGHHILENSMLNLEGAPPWAHVFSKPLIED